MTFGLVFAIVWGIFAIAMSLNVIVNSESMTRAAVERQGGDPDAPKSQWLYPFTRALGWIGLACGCTAEVLGLAGVLM